MCEVTKEMVKLWKMDKYDWMYYKVSDETPFTYHHLFIPTRKDPKRTIENGAVLCGNCKLPSAGGSHAYIHIIEKIDPDRFDAISLILAEVNFQGFMTTQKQFEAIDDILKGFEREYCSLKTNKKEPLIKESFVKRGIY
ncbi:MAG: hypothetical protein IJB82_02400 [Bacilli bacterium]|nr:hypothetical protein [Bacilli bacterium]